MSKKKFFTSALSALMLMSSPFVSLAAADAPQTSKAKVKLVYVMEGQLPVDADAELISILKSSGWNINGNTMTKRINARNMEVQVKGKDLKADDAGVLDMDITNAEEDITIVDNLNGSDLKVKAKKNQTTTVEKKLSFSKMLEGMGASSTMHTDNTGTVSDHGFKGFSDGEKPSYGATTHCNRFNGYQGDGKYYADHTSAKAIKNFAYSDCDWALSLWTVACLRDYVNWDEKYCAGEPKAKNASCSNWADINPFVEHAKYYHMHTSSNAPIN